MIAHWKRIDRGGDGHKEARVLLCTILDSIGLTYDPEDFPPRSRNALSIREPLHLSIAHTPGVVAAVVGDAPVGIDVQHNQSISQRLWEEFLAPCVPSSWSPMMAWATLEAIAKTGLTSLGKARRGIHIDGDGYVMYRGQRAGHVLTRSYDDFCLAVFSTDVTASMVLGEYEGR